MDGLTSDGAGEHEAGLDRIVTVPNLLSLGRIILLGVFVWLLFGPDLRIAATVVLMVVGITDFLDGYVARHFDQVTTLGKVLDPVADRVVLLTGVIAIAAYGAVPWWLAGVVILREVVVSGAVLALAALGAERIDVIWFGKAGTFGLMCCFPLFLLGDSSATWAKVLTDDHLDRRRPGARAQLHGARVLRARRPQGARRPAPPRTSGGRPVKAVIMAGGEGTRLRPLTANQPKPMLPMANRPMAEHVIELLRRHGFDEIVVTVGFLANTIRTYFGDGSEFGVRLVLRDRGDPARDRRARC